MKFPECEFSRLLPRLGSDARITIDLPPSENYPPRALECTGRVVREAGSPKDAPILAFEISRMLIRDREGVEEQEGDRLVQ